MSSAVQEPWTVRLSRAPCRLHQFGAGTPRILALHGFSGSGADFEGLAQVKDLSLCCPDLPGHGLSPVLPMASSQWLGGMELCVEHLAELVAAEFVARPLLLGYSMGGRLALSAALRYPDLFSSLVLIGASPGLQDDSERNERRVLDEQRASSMEQDGLDAFMAAWEQLPLLRSQRRMEPELWARFSARRRTADVSGLAWSLRAMGTGSMPPLWEQLPQLQLPVLLIAGAEDQRYLKLAEQMSRRLPSARCEFIQGCGHSPHLERPESVASLLEQLLACL